MTDGVCKKNHERPVVKVQKEREHYRKNILICQVVRLKTGGSKEFEESEQAVNREVRVLGGDTKWMKLEPLFSLYNR